MVGIGDGGGVGDGGEKPAWLERLMEETFFTGCGAHETRRKNEKNIFCLACCLSFCPHCLPSHRSHPLLQVRRYVYHDVVRLVDFQKLIDCSFIQPYTINGAKVIFLKQRTQSSRVQSSRVWKQAATPNLCFTCDRILQPPFHFCSLSCKVDHMVCQGEELTSLWMSSSSQLEGLRVDNTGLLPDEDEEDDDNPITTTPNSTSQDDHPFLPDSRFQPDHYYSSYDHGNSPVAPYPPASSSSGGDMFMKRKKKGGGGSATLTSTSSSGGGRSGGSGTGSGTSRFLSVFSLASRRKGAPHRAPLS